ncbi:MAG: hypothetical protein EBU88_16855, partial [Acidobacteria bacterium]|nr:hypothetical protein [Acidobacteriota bacterium]
QTIRWAQNNVTMNARRLGDAIRALTGDAGARVRFDQESLITSQRYVVKFTAAPGSFSADGAALGATITIETPRAGVGADNEQQRITLDVGTATGTFKVAIPRNGRTYTTTSLPFTASAADVQSAINTAISSIGGAVAVTKTTDGTLVKYDITYAGTLAAQNLDNATVTAIADAPTPGGSFSLTYGGQTTAAINLVSSTANQAAAIQTALQTLTSIGSNNVAVTYDATSAAIAPRFLITFINNLADTPATAITADETGLLYASATPRNVTTGRTATGETQAVTLTKPTSDGTFTLSLTHNSTTRTTNALSFDITAADLQTALSTAISTITGATVTVNSWNGTDLSVTFGGALAGVDLANLTGTVTGSVTPAGILQTTEGFERPEVPSVDETLVVDYVADPLTIATGPSTTFTFTMDGQLGELTEASGHLKGTLASFADVEGDFYFKRTLKAGVARLTIGASGVTAFVGNRFGTSDATGFELTNGKLGLVVLEKTSSDPARYALTTTGTVGLKGLADFTLAGNLELQLQRFNAPIDETIPVGSGSVRVKYD